MKLTWWIDYMIYKLNFVIVVTVIYYYHCTELYEIPLPAQLKVS